LTNRSSLFGFFFCAYAFSWVCWLSVVAASWGAVDLLLPEPLLTTLGQFGPFLAALLLTALQSGKSGLRELGSSLWRWKVHLVWFGVALLLPPVSFVLAIGANSLVSGAAPGFKPVSIFYDVFINFFLILVWGGPLGEELGWRGFALPRLQAGLSPLVASLVLGVAWAAWHLPIFLMQGAFTIPVFALYIVGTVALTILFTWLYHGTKGSVLLAMLFHGSISTFYVILPIEPAFRMWVVLLWVLALLIVATQPGWFSRRATAQPLLVSHKTLPEADERALSHGKSCQPR
jgi:membrane protease YdiL (CAAX protease family)